MPYYPEKFFEFCLEQGINKKVVKIRKLSILDCLFAGFLILRLPFLTWG